MSIRRAKWPFGCLRRKIWCEVGHIQGSDRLITESALSGEYLMWLVKIQNQPFKVNFFEKKPF